MSTYSELLKDPRWQKRRLQILEKDNFTCQVCGDSTKTLHVHHMCYHRGMYPWDYSDEILITLCEECHKREEELKKEPINDQAQHLLHNWINEILTETLVALWYSKNRLATIKKIIDFIKTLHG